MLLRCCRRDNERSRPVSIHVHGTSSGSCLRSIFSVTSELTHHRCAAGRICAVLVSRHCKTPIAPQCVASRPPSFARPQRVARTSPPRRRGCPVPKCPAAAGMPRPGPSPALATCPISRPRQRRSRRRASVRRPPPRSVPRSRHRRSPNRHSQQCAPRPDRRVCPVVDRASRRISSTVRSQQSLA